MILKKILAVDDEPNNLQVLRQILKEKYQLLFAPNGEKALEAAHTHHPDLILLDVMMPGISGYEVCRRLKSDAMTKDIPVIFVTAMSEVEDESKGFDVGAVDYIQKPVSAPIVKRRIETHLSLVHARELERSRKEAIYMLGEAGHYNDCDTGLHIWRMAAYARALAESIGWPEHLADRLELAAPMHDTGKIGIPDEVLKAPRSLSPEEWTTMRKHCQIGISILSKSKSPVFIMAAEIAKYHHEKWDGSGYPEGLAAEEIPLSARITAVADVFDALTMKRSYKEAWPVEEAFNKIEDDAGSHFDPALVDHFLRIKPTILQIKAHWDQLEVQHRLENGKPDDERCLEE